MSRRWAGVALVGIALVLGTAACGTTTAGQPRPAAQPPSTASSGDNSTSAASTLPVDHVCSLLSTGDLAQLSVTKPPTQEMVGTAPTCDADTSAYSIGVGIRTDSGLAGFPAGSAAVTDLRVGGHQGKQELDDTGACTIGLGVSATARLDVVADAFDGSNPCSETLKVARLVEPALS
jgi:hypothetical protein